MNDFDRIEKVILYLDAHHTEQPTLGALASAAGLSESHLHRLFRRWAGVTPKDFLQFLTLEHAKARLRESASVLSSALDAGLSGPGRLHDLTVTFEAATPGELKRRGADMRIDWGMCASPFGWCSLGWNDRGLCHLAFHDSDEIQSLPPELLESWPQATFRRQERAAQGKGRDIFTDGRHGAPSLRAFVRGTNFQVKVGRALLHIPEGCLASYGMIARAIGQQGAVRAVGSACGANPIAYLIPCHRVIRETGVVQGYRWGSVRKRAMLAKEFSK